MKRKTTNEFINEAYIIHNNKYKYSLVNYKNNRIKVKIICPIHGVFEQSPTKHLSGQGCPKCTNNIKYTSKDFVNKANIIHDKKYDYSLVDYINNRIKIKIICPIHGVFEQTPNNHLSKKQGCPKCKGGIKFLQKDYIEKVKKIHNNKYDYKKVNYINCYTKIKIICPIHGVFEQRPANHLNHKYGCPKCNESHGEKEIRKELEKYNIIYEYQKTFKNCKYKCLLKFDFYLPLYNICIEFDGKQHFESNNFFGGNDALIYEEKRDYIKNIYCKHNNIKLLRIKYDQNISDILKNEILINE